MGDPRQAQGWISRAAFGALALAVIVLPISAQGQTFTTLYSFPNVVDGNGPHAGLIRDTDGNFYGTTVDGGGGGNCGQTSECGAVFKLDKTGKETVLYAFTGGADGGVPEAGLILDPAGNLYGTASIAGSRLYGVVFKLDPTGKETVLYNFSGHSDGRDPNGGVIRDEKGNLCGATVEGGALRAGVVFKLDSSGRETVLHSFGGNNDGAYPYAGLIRDAEGNLYGTTAAGGKAGCFMDQGCGTVFKIDAQGKETVLYRFGSRANDGANPYGALIRDTRGNLYGTTFSGGIIDGCQYGCGTVFKVSASGKETVLYRFTGAQGCFPNGGLVRDAAGNLYGTTLAGGHANCPDNYSTCGTIFRLDPSGKETTLHAFANSTDGANPFDSLILDSEGNLYGTASGGGNFNCDPTFGCGTVFKLKP
jgi:uncharacterized repeat protein (TIGR03803 family)